MNRLKQLLARLGAKRVRVERPSPGVEWAEGLLSNDRRVGEWTERVGDATERTTYVDGRKHGPSLRVREDGTRILTRSFHDGEPHGPFASFHDNGRPFCTCTFEHGKLVGRYTHHDEDGNLTVDFTSRAGRRHGRYRELASNGVVTLEGEYVDGQREGVFTKRTEVGTVLEVATYANDAFDGVWSSFYEDGRPLLAANYRAGVPSFEAWTAAGAALGPIDADTPEDAARFVALAGALEGTDARAVETALRALPARLAEAAVRLCDARNFDGVTVYALERWFDVSDPRFALARALVVDNARLDAGHLAALRSNGRLVDLALHEVEIAGSLSRCLAPGAAMRLERLTLSNCYGDTVIDGLMALSDSDVAESLVELTLAIGEQTDPSSALRAILLSHRFHALAYLEVGHELFSVLDALASGPPWSCLKELVVRRNVPAEDRAAFLGAMKKRAFPALSRIEIEDAFEDDASAAFAEQLAASLGCAVED